MSGIVSALVGGVTAFVTVTVAAIPEATEALSPLFETQQEFVTLSAALVFAVPSLIVLTLLANAAGD